MTRTETEWRTCKLTTSKVPMWLLTNQNKRTCNQCCQSFKYINMMVKKRFDYLKNPYLFDTRRERNKSQKHQHRFPSPRGHVYVHLNRTHQSITNSGCFYFLAPGGVWAYTDTCVTFYLVKPGTCYRQVPGETFLEPKQIKPEISLLSKTFL